MNKVLNPDEWYSHAKDVAMHSSPYKTMSNTTSQKRIKHQMNGGEDHMDVGMNVCFGPSWPALYEQLNNAKLLSATCEKKREEPATIQLGRYKISVMPRGWKHGSGRSGTYYQFELVYNGVRILFSNNGNPALNQLNVRLIASGNSCLIHGGYGCLILIRDIIKQAGGCIRSEVLSRVDMRLDIPGEGGDKFWNATREKRYITLSKMLTETEQYKRTIRFGKYPLSFIIYDKLAQVEAMAGSELTMHVIHRCWNGKMPKQATRLEYRIGREMLRKKGINSPDDYFRKRGALIKYLTTSWIRFTSSPVKRGNSSRTPILPLWKEVAEAFARWAGQPNGESLTPLPPSGPVDVTPLLKQGYGLVGSIARKQDKIPVSYDHYCGLTLNHAMAPKESK